MSVGESVAKFGVDVHKEQRVSDVKNAFRHWDWWEVHGIDTERRDYLSIRFAGDTVNVLLLVPWRASAQFPGEAVPYHSWPTGSGNEAYLSEGMSYEEVCRGLIHLAHLPQYTAIRLKAKDYRKTTRYTPDDLRRLSQWDSWTVRIGFTPYNDRIDLDFAENRLQTITRRRTANEFPF